MMKNPNSEISGCSRDLIGVISASAERHHHTVLAIHDIERHAARAYEHGNDVAARVLIATANLLRTTVPFPVSSGGI